MSLIYATCACDRLIGLECALKLYDVVPFYTLLWVIINYYICIGSLYPLQSIKLLFNTSLEKFKIKKNCNKRKKPFKKEFNIILNKLLKT